MAKATLTISSKTYSAWSLRGWLLCRLAGLDITEQRVEQDANDRAELLLLSPSVLVPRLTHEGASVWDTLAIAEYLHELYPDASMLPTDRVARAHCRSICGEIHSGFTNLRSALPMNLKMRHEKFPVFSGARPDIERIETIWQECLAQYGGPFLFGAKPTVADAMYAPVATRFKTHDVKLGRTCETYRDRILDWTYLRDWTVEAFKEEEAIEELEVEF